MSSLVIARSFCRYAEHDAQAAKRCRSGQLFRCIGKLEFDRPVIGREQATDQQLKPRKANAADFGAVDEERLALIAALRHFPRKLRQCPFVHGRRKDDRAHLTFPLT